VFLTEARPPIIVSPNSMALYEGYAFIVIEQVFCQGAQTLKLGCNALEPNRCKAF
jgi:hypothetical protein